MKDETRWKSYLAVDEDSVEYVSFVGLFSGSELHESVMAFGFRLVRNTVGTDPRAYDRTALLYNGLDKRNLHEQLPSVRSEPC